MSRPLRRFAAIVLCAAYGLAAAPLMADTYLDVEYAEHQPLAVHSMLLDVTRADQRLVAVGERGHVVLSDDGREWVQAETVPTRSTLTTVFSFGGRLWAAGHDAVIITSGDRGNTWSRQFFDPERQQAVMDLYFTDEKNGVAIGSYGLYLVTSDGGQNWEDGTVDEENQFHLNGMVRFADGRRVIAGEAGYSYRSQDDGETWEALDLPYPGSMWGALKTSKGCVVFFGLRGHVLESCDFGDSWAELPTRTEASITGAAEHQGMVVFVGNSGTVLTWAGRHLTEYKHSSGVDFAAALPLGGGLFLLVGEDGTHRFPEESGDGDGQ
jgi:photosystem II stability/assembly factor-like uncharacterized protein